MKKILIANRGEIAVRIIRAAAELGIATVAIYSDPDAQSLHVTLADEAYPLNGSEAKETYLVSDKIIAIARAAKVDAIHPGYGFLAENAAFAAAVRQAGIKFIGPDEKIIRALGSKTEARALAIKAGVPVVPGWQGSTDKLKEIEAWAELTGYPVLIKAAAGGGGRGMRVVNQASDLLNSLQSASQEALAFFGSSEVFLEKYLQRPRHIEVQILGDEHGKVIHLGERECSLQRRHQKVLEEAPSPSIDAKTREGLYAAALKLANSVKYSSAGTVEFIVDEQNQFYFLEVNTRLQVEHPVTEAVTGVDLVKAQLLLAQGHPLFLKQEDIQIRGHAIEARVCAEDPEHDYLPSTGKIGLVQWPENIPGVRIDSFLQTGDVISPYYDSMLAKVIAFGFNRKEALQKLGYGLRNTVILGIKHNLNFVQDLLQAPEVVSGQMHTHFIEAWLPAFKAQLGKYPIPQEILAELKKNSAPRRLEAKSSNNDTALWQNVSGFRNV